MDAGLDRPPRRATLDDDYFQSPPRTDRPGMRWWWQTPVPPEELVRELAVIAEAGFGEVEIGFSPGFWADDAQRAGLSAVLHEAARLDVGVSLTLGAEWPLRTPNTTSDTEHVAQELQYGVGRPVDGDEWIAVPLPFDDEEGTRSARLLAVTAARVLHRGSAPTLVTVQEHSGERQSIVNPDVSTRLEQSSLVDLTGLVLDGQVPWSSRDGEWVVFAFWMRDCEQGATSFLDRSAAEAAASYLDEFEIGAANQQELSRIGSEMFEDSLELNADSLFWAHDLPARFRARFGYDIVPYLPVLFAHGMCRYWVPDEEPIADFELGAYSDQTGGRIRRDYYRLLTDLYVDDHLLPLQRWATRHGMRFKAQVAYGQNLEPIRSNREFVRNGGRAEAESLNSGDRAPVSRHHPNWRFALDWQRSIVGGAHQGGATRISTELGAQFNAPFAFTLGDYKQILDKEWAAGITKPFVHGFATQEASSPWPTQSRFFDFVAQSWNDSHYPEWTNWRPLTDYWTRGTAVLETGVPRTDVAYYREGFLTTAARGTAEMDFTAPDRLADTRSLERAGYSVQYIDPLGLSESRAIGTDGEIRPDGPAYRGLVLDERAITPEAAEAIDEAAARGLRVVIVGEAPQCDSGFANGAHGDAQVKAAITRLLTRPTVAHVGDANAAAAAFAGLGLIPRVEPTGGDEILTQWRDAGNTSYLLVYNTASEGTSPSLSIEGSGSLSELDLWNGSRSPLEHEEIDGRTVADVSLEPLGLRILEFSHGRAPARCPAERTRWRQVDLSQWSLVVTTEEPEGPRVLTLDGQGPGDWRGIDSLVTVSGTGVYTATAANPGAPFRLVLGELAGSATVRVDGVHYGTFYVSGVSVNVKPAPDRTHVTIEIEVRTALHNAVVGTGQRPNVISPTQAQGLIGPVRLLATVPGSTIEEA